MTAHDLHVLNNGVAALKMQTDTLLDKTQMVYI